MKATQMDFILIFFILQRPSAKELLKHRFIRNARKTPHLLEKIRCSDTLCISFTNQYILSCRKFDKIYIYSDRERPKFQLKEDGILPDGTKVLEGSGTVKMTSVTRVEDTVRARYVV